MAEDAAGQEGEEAVGVVAVGEDLAGAAEVVREVAEDSGAVEAAAVVVDQEGGVVEAVAAVVADAEAVPREVASRGEKPSSSSHIVTRASSLPVARRTRWSR